MTDYEVLEFDAANRVTAVVKGTRRSEFFYDGMGRRVRMVEREGTTVASDRRYLWDGGEIVEERDGQNTGGVTKRYFGAGVQEVAANATTNLFYSRDHLGSVREVTDANGNLVARYDYDAWGRRTRVFGTYEADWGYAGYFVHHASKLNLTWYRAYDPDLGRWVSRDPIGEIGGINLFKYVENNPISNTDKLGLRCEKETAAVAAAAYAVGTNCSQTPFNALGCSISLTGLYFAYRALKECLKTPPPKCPKPEDPPPYLFPDNGSSDRPPRRLPGRDGSDFPMSPVPLAPPPRPAAPAVPAPSPSSPVFIPPICIPCICAIHPELCGMGQGGDA